MLTTSMNVNDWATLVRDILVSGAAMATAWAAVKGLNIWKRELRWRKDFETASCLLEATYHLRDIISACRNPFTQASEYPSDYNVAKRTRKIDAAAKSYISKNRLAPIAAVEKEFRRYALRAKVLWGNEVGKATDELLGCIRDLEEGIDAHVYYTVSISINDDLEHKKKVENIIRDSPGEPNAFTKEINSAIQQIEDIVRPHLKNETN